MRYLTIALVVASGSLLGGCGGGGGASGGSLPTIAKSGAVVGSQVKRPAATGGGQYAALVESANPIAYYRLNDTGSTLVDSGANQLGGTYGANVTHGAAPMTSSNDQSSTFPGSPAGADVPSNTAIVAPNAAFMTATNALTVEAWIKPADYNRTGTFMPIVSYGRGAIGNTWAMQVTPQSSLDFYMKTTSTSYELKPGTAKLNPNQIYQVVVTYNGSTLSMYMNGTLVGSMAAAGALNYTGTTPLYGLSIGGELNNGRPIFNGPINDLSIYASALSATDVNTHFTVGQIATPVVEQPVSSDGFVDSIGVVTHLRSSGTAYVTAWPTFASLISAAGIRHIGDALITTPTWYPQHLAQLASTGIHASLISDLTETPQTIASSIATFNGSIEAVEGPNEPDLSGDPNWVADTQAFQQMLWSTVKSTSPGLRVVGPSVTSEAHSIALGNLSSYMDNVSIHDYFSGYNPGTAGWGSLDQYGVYGSLSWQLNIAKIVGGSKPVISTETGYSSLPSNGGSVDSRTLAKYIPRTYLEHYINGIYHTTTYEFYDEPCNTNFCSFGLVDVNNNPRSSYYALKSMIGALADPGGSFATTSLSYVLGGSINNVHHLLLQKRDGTYELVIWVEAQGYDPNAKVDLPIAPQTVTFAPTTTRTSATLSTIGDSGSLTTSPVSFTNGVASFSIDDHVSILTFK